MNTPAERKGRAVEIIAREAAEFISRESGSGSLITVIRAQAASHGDRVLVFVSIFPEDKARPALAFLERQREAFSDHLKMHTRLRPLPRIEFMLDNREGTGAPLSEQL
jgi:ribosome-binding factor A